MKAGDTNSPVRCRRRRALCKMLRHVQRGGWVDGLPIFEIDESSLLAFAQRRHRDGPEYAPIAPFPDFAIRLTGSNPVALQVISEPPEFSIRWAAARQSYFELWWGGDIDDMRFKLVPVVDGSPLAGADTGDEAELGRVGSVMLGMVLDALDFINTQVIVEETVDRRRPNRIGKPIKRNERKLVHKKLVVLTPEQAKVRWGSAPGHRGRKCPHLRRSHLRTLSDGRRVVVRACAIHEEDFVWVEHGKTYRVVGLVPAANTKPSASQRDAQSGIG